jgi:hypothetical protein
MQLYINDKSVAGGPMTAQVGNDFITFFETTVIRVVPVVSYII